jgi:ankyrin repeat protein
MRGAEAALLLIRRGADVNAQDVGHKTPLHLASSTGREETVRLLIQHRANINAHDEGYSTPLHLAISSAVVSVGYFNIVDLLLRHGADGHGKDGIGRTPFQIALSNGLSQIAELLSAHGLRVDSEEYYLHCRSILDQ